MFQPQNHSLTKDDKGCYADIFLQYDLLPYKIGVFVKVK